MDEKTQTAQGDRRWLLVRAGGAAYALPARDVRFVVRGLVCHPVPGARPRLLGLAQYGGEPLAVLDLHALAEGGAAQTSQRVTVVLGRRSERRAPAVGLAVDAALRVAEFSGPQSPDDGRLVQGALSVDDETVTVLDTSVLMADRWRAGGWDDD